MTNERVVVWDRFVRFFHWSLVILFVTAYLTGEDAEMLHAYAGYGIAALVAARVVWGFAGSAHARFGDFIRGPRAVFGYLKKLWSGQPRHYLGHNPAGGWMVVALLFMITVTALSGMQLYGLEGHGPLAPDATLSVQLGKLVNRESATAPSERKAAKEYWEEIHETAANLTLLLVAVHIVAVIVSSRLHRENLVKAMLLGFKETADHK